MVFWCDRNSHKVLFNGASIVEIRRIIHHRFLRGDNPADSSFPSHHVLFRLFLLSLSVFGVFDFGLTLKSHNVRRQEW